MIQTDDPIRSSKIEYQTVEDEIIKELGELDLTDSMNKFLLLIIYHVVTENSIDNLQDINIQNVLYYTTKEIKTYLRDSHYLKIRRILQYKNKSFSFSDGTCGSEMTIVSTPVFIFRLKEGYPQYTYQYKKCVVTDRDLKVHGTSLEQILVQFNLSEIKYIEFEGYKFYDSFLLSLCNKEELYLQEMYLKNRLDPENEFINSLEYDYKMGYISYKAFIDDVKEHKVNKKKLEIRKVQEEKAKAIFEQYQNIKVEFPKIPQKLTLCQRIKNYFTKQEESYNEFI